jgi:hypothetical protein
LKFHEAPQSNVDGDTATAPHTSGSGGGCFVLFWPGGHGQNSSPVGVVIIPQREGGVSWFHWTCAGAGRAAAARPTIARTQNASGINLNPHFQIPELVFTIVASLHFPGIVDPLLISITLVAAWNASGQRKPRLTGRGIRHWVNILSLFGDGKVNS